jgi:hypothetical protein
LKQARQRASRLFLNDDARSSLLQYRQINFSPFGFACDDRGGRLAAFLVFEAGAPFALVAAVFFLAKADASLAIDSLAVGSVSMLISILLLWPGLWHSDRLQHTLLRRGQMGSGFGTSLLPKEERKTCA